MRLDDDDYTLFGLPPQFALDRSQLDTQWRRLQAATHPDRFASEGASAQRLAMQWVMRVNEAYQRLKDPIKRAAYLCELRGASVDAERNTAMPAHFLMQQMAWREALEDASSVADVAALQVELDGEQQAALVEVERLLDATQKMAQQGAQKTAQQGTNPAQAAQQVRALMFMSRFRQDVERKLDKLDPNR